MNRFNYKIQIANDAKSNSFSASDAKQRRALGTDRSDTLGTDRCNALRPIGGRVSEGSVDLSQALRQILRREYLLHTTRGNICENIC